METKLNYPGAPPGGLECEVTLDGEDLRARCQSGQQFIFPLRASTVSLRGIYEAEIRVEYREHTVYLERKLWERRLKLLHLDCFQQELSKSWSQHWLENRRRLASLLVLALICAGLWWASNFGVARAVASTPVSWEVELGNAAVPHVKAFELDAVNDKALRDLFEELTSTYADRGFAWHLQVSEDEVENAFALPGGNVVVNTGLLKAASGPDELAGVLAHEIHHVVLHHGLRQLYGSMRLQLLMTALSGGDPGRQNVLGRASELTTLGFSRSMETEADTYGVNLLVAKNINPIGIDQFFKRMGAKEGVKREVLNFNSTHPTSKSREANVEKLIAEAGEHKWRTLPFDWAKLRKELP